MSDAGRIATLEARIAALEARLAAVEGRATAGYAPSAPFSEAQCPYCYQPVSRCRGHNICGVAA